MARFPTASRQQRNNRENAPTVSLKQLRHLLSVCFWHYFDDSSYNNISTANIGTARLEKGVQNKAISKQTESIITIMPS
jgi:hypothetical protein